MDQYKEEDAEFNDKFIEVDSKQFQFSQVKDLLDQFRFDLNEKKVAIARFGGIIAVCRDITKNEFFELNDPLRDHICFYNSYGLIQSKRKFDRNLKIVGFDFNFEEQLVVVLETGQYLIFDPCQAEWNKNVDKVIQLDFGRNFSEDLIHEAKIFRNAIAFQTRSNKFYFKTNLLSSPLEEYSPSKIVGEIKCWTIVPPGFSGLDEKFELQLANPGEKGGITCLSDDPQRTRIQYNGSESLTFDDNIFVCLQNVKAIASNDSGEWLAYLTQNGQGDKEEWMIHILSSDIDDECYRKIRVKEMREIYALQKEKLFKETPISFVKDQQGSSPSPSPNSSQKLGPYTSPQVKIKMYWVEKHMVAIHIGNQLILVGERSSLLSDFNTDIISGSAIAFTCLQEVDSVKIVTQNKILLLRSTPQHYLDIFNSTFPTSASILFNQFKQNIKNKDIDPSSDDDIRNNPQSLLEGVAGCIVAGAYELNKSRQEQLLKAASFGQIFLHSLCTNETQSENEEGEYNLTSVCKLLRVAFQLNNQKYSRTMTYQQTKYLEERYPEVLVSIMLRYNYHYIALEILKFLHLDKYKGIVYVHWAGCKIERNESDSAIIEAIQQKLQGKSGISFTDIAHKALHHGKPQIALQLLSYEPCIQKRIPVLLWMAKYLREENKQYFEKALNEALQSKDSTLIYMVIRTIWAQEGENSYSYFAQEEILSLHFQKFLRVEMQSQYIQLYNYLLKMKQWQKAGFFLMEQAERVQNSEQEQKLFEQAKNEFQKEVGDKLYTTMIDEHIKLLKNCEEFSISTRRVSQTPTTEISGGKGTPNSLSQCLRHLINQRQDRAVQKLQSELKINDKRLNFCKIKSLIESSNPSDANLIESVLDVINKKSIEIPPELVADLLLKKGMVEIAFNVALRIQDIGKQQMLLSHVHKIVEQNIIMNKNQPNQKNSQQISPQLLEKIELALQLHQSQ